MESKDMGVSPGKPTLSPAEETFVLGLIGSEKRVLEAQAEVHRELQVRERCYGKWVDEGKLSKLCATEQFNRMKTAKEILGKLLDMCPNASEVPF